MKTVNDNIIITIDSELYSDSRSLADELSRMTGIPCYGEEILDTAARLSGIAPRLMHQYDGRPVMAAYDFLADDHSPLRLPSAADFITAQVLACREIADSGSCILLDRHASMAMKDRKHVSLFVHAGFEDRARRLAEAEHCDMTEAERRLKKEDRRYRNYYRGNNPFWGEAEHYDMTVNVSDAAVSTLSETIVHFLATHAGVAARAQAQRKIG